MSIEDIFKLAEEHNASLRSCKTAEEEAKAAIASANTEKLPDISASLSLSYLGAGHLWDRDFKNGKYIDMPHFGNNFAIKASQAVYTGGAITSQIELAKLSHKMSTFQVESTRNSMRFMLVGYYLQLAMLENQLSVYDANIALTENVILQMRARYQEGVALKNDITRYELQLDMTT